MRRTPVTLSTLILLGFAHVASAYEYRLQFTPQSGARGLVVAGYEFNGSTVIGNCSYDTTSPCSGRGCHTVTVHHDNTCIDLALATDAGANKDFTQRFTVTGVSICDD